MYPLWGICQRARERGQKVMTAARAPRPCKTLRQNPAGQILAEIAHHVGRDRIAVGIAGTRQVQPRFQVPLHHLINHRPLRPPRLVSADAFSASWSLYVKAGKPNFRYSARGNRSELGSRAYALLARVIETCRRRAAVVLYFLGHVIHAARKGLTLPALPGVPALPA